MPYNKNDKPFYYNKEVVYCGYSICNWKLRKEYNNKYLKIAIILLDTKTLIESYFNRNKDIKLKLINQIENVKI